jgi:hypothetical protein
LIGVALMNVHRDLRISGNSSRTSRRWWTMWRGQSSPFVLVGKLYAYFFVGDPLPVLRTCWGPSPHLKLETFRGTKLSRKGLEFALRFWLRFLE